MEKHSMNEKIRVQLTSTGKQIYKHYLYKLRKYLDKHISDNAIGKEKTLQSCDEDIAKIDQNTWFTFILYDFMRIFGHECVMGMPNIVIDCNIYFGQD